MTRHKRLLGLILLLYLALATAYSAAIPIFEAPDELQHVFFAVHLAEGKGLPVLRAETGRPWHEEGFPPRPYTAVWAQEGAQPPLYYAIAALLLSPLDTRGAENAIRLNPHANIGDPLRPGNKNRMVHTPAEAWPWHGLSLAVHVVRFLSVLLGLGTVYLSYRLGVNLFPSRPALALTVAALTAFNPQFIFISSAVSNDNLIIFLATLTLYLLLRVCRAENTPGPSWRLTLGLGLVAGLGVLTKLSGLNLLFLIACVFMLAAWRTGRWLPFARRLAVILVMAAGMGGWWYARNHLLYGDPLAFDVFLQIVGKRPTPLTLATMPTEMQGLRISMLGLFGWFNIPLPAWVYRLWDLFLGATLLGLLLRLWRQRRSLKRGLWLRRGTPYLWLALWLLILFVSLLRWTALTPGTQGRLLFPAIAALNVFLALGWEAWRPGRPRWLALSPLALLSLSLLSLPLVILPAYRHPATIPPEQVPAEARIEPILIDNRIQLLGITVSPQSLQPGDLIDLTLYWQAVAPTPYDASIFVHLLGPGNQSVGELNTYPGWGAFPTSLWPQGQVVVDSYQMRIPNDVDAPTLLKIDVGLFDYETKESYPSATLSGSPAPVGQALVAVHSAQDRAGQAATPSPLFRFGDSIALLRFDVEPPEARAGQELAIELVWQALQPMSQDYQVFVQLLDAGGQRVAGYDAAPRDGWWPTSVWEPGEQAPDSLRLAIPADLPPGDYSLILGLYRMDTLARLAVSGPPEQVQDNAALLTTVQVRP